ncbi:MAG TPA: ADP-forming succinate--CoA ligase subunit beta [Alphaproteobacteria bacterium]|nr:MAG: ADP-forming succinate--CoA ligase subunit beta [SAR116 cluster bacterium MED-G06]RPG87161.1 MAG: ADP-forming succinate--CoA ligase subunit beta [Candidatus Puniceispirillum sp. TMED245]HCV88649.1 ADP-forming succinate--CoA ligase subunit beta [Alphaproteobacteria bacterium]|tara:strand:- start:4238 stop:5398 length:1161 start_codon:yes stop_codon:yes gene_type:complete
MNIHEHQAKALLAGFGVPVPRGEAAFSVDEAVAGANALGGPVYVVKAQIHAGGRGKAGGVKVVKSVDEVRDVATALLGKTLVTHQTGPQGREVQRLYVEEGCDIGDELYLSLLVDRGNSRVTFIASSEGGMDIEEVAETHPEKILSLGIDPATGLQPHHVRRLAAVMGLSKDTAKQLPSFLSGLYRAFTELDASLVEINPLVVTGSGDLLALDAKMSFDGNALYRHADLMDLRDLAEEDPAEVRASEFELNYIKLDGNIGCMVNGAGLAMATMDIIQLRGGSPANFLDVGGSATAERVTEAFKIILSDANVKGILVNIFGGIMRCDIIAEGVVSAARTLGLDKPLVVRLEGTNVEEGKKIMADSGLDIIPADNLADAATKIVAATA